MASSLDSDKIVGNLKQAAKPPPTPPVPLTPARATLAQALSALQTASAAQDAIVAPIAAGEAAKRVLEAVKAPSPQAESTALSASIQKWLQAGGKGAVPAPDPSALAAATQATQAAAIAQMQYDAIEASLVGLRVQEAAALANVISAQTVAQRALLGALAEEAIAAKLELDAADASRRATAAKLAGLHGVMRRLPEGAAPAELIRKRLDANLQKLDPSSDECSDWRQRWAKLADQLANDPTATLESNS